MPTTDPDPTLDHDTRASGHHVGIARFASLTDNAGVMQIAQATENLGHSAQLSTSRVNRNVEPPSGALGALLAEVDSLPRMELRDRFEQEANALRGALDRFQRNGKHEVHPDLRDLRVFLRVVLAEAGPHPGKPYSLDRIDHARGYEPGNLKWSDKTEQSLNRPTTPMMPDRDGVLVPVSVMAKKRKKVTAATALKRRKRGWSPEDATSRPKGTRLASMKAQGATRETGGESVRAAWEVWSSAFVDAYGAAPPGWGGKERGQMKDVLRRLDLTSTEPLVILRWIVGTWTLILDRHFGWMRDHPPPSRPDVGFLGGKNLTRFHSAYLDAHSTRDIPNGPDGEAMRWLRAEGHCNLRAQAILDELAVKQAAIARREAEVAAQEKHLAFLARVQERERQSLGHQRAALREQGRRQDGRMSGEPPRAHYVVNPALFDPSAAGRIVPTMIATPNVARYVRHRTRSQPRPPTPPTCQTEPEAA